MTFEDIQATLFFLDDWDERYRFIIDLGRMLPPFPEAERTEVNKVSGCASQVWLVAHQRNVDGTVYLDYHGDSDAHIVRGLVAIVLALFSGRSAREIAEVNARAVFDAFGLAQHLTAQRSNGLFAMIARIQTEARSLLVTSA